MVLLGLPGGFELEMVPLGTVPFGTVLLSLGASVVIWHRGIRLKASYEDY